MLRHSHAAAATDHKAIAEAFAQQAYTAVGNRDREIMRDPYLLGFEIVEKNEDNSRLIGVFAFRVNREILMVTVFYLNGKIKGTDLLYRKGVNLFTYNGEKWISYLLSQDEDEDGRAVARSGGGNRARMNLGLGDMYSNPVSGGYKRASAPVFNPGYPTRFGAGEAPDLKGAPAVTPEQMKTTEWNAAAPGANAQARWPYEGFYGEPTKENTAMWDALPQEVRDYTPPPSWGRSPEEYYKTTGYRGLTPQVNQPMTLGGAGAPAPVSKAPNMPMTLGGPGAPAPVSKAPNMPMTLSSGKQAAELPDDPTECESDPAEGMGEDSDDCCKECGEGKACTCDKEKTSAAIHNWWADMTAAAPNAEAEPLFRQMLVDGGLGKQAAELVERLPELGDIIVLAKALEQPLKQSGVNAPPLGNGRNGPLDVSVSPNGEMVMIPGSEAVATPEPTPFLPGDAEWFRTAGRVNNNPSDQDWQDMNELQARLDRPNDRPDPEGAPGAEDNRAAAVAEFNAQQALKNLPLDERMHAQGKINPPPATPSVPFVGPPAPDKQANAIIWHAEPQAGWSEDMVSEFYRKGYLLEDKRAAANLATAFETEGIEQRMATARGAGVMRVLDRGGKSHKVLFGPRTPFYNLDETPSTSGTGRTNKRYEMLFLDGPHKDMVYKCHDEGPGYDPLVEEQNGEAEDLEIPKGEQPKAGKSYQLWLDGKGFVGYGSFEVYDVNKSGDAVRINGEGKGTFAVVRSDLDTSDFSAEQKVFGKDMRFIPVGPIPKDSQDTCCPTPVKGEYASAFVPLTPKDVMFGGRKAKTASVQVNARRGLSEIIWNGERVCSELTGKQLVLKLARDLRLPVEDAEDIAFSLEDGGRREFTWIAPMRKYAASPETLALEQMKKAAARFDRLFKAAGVADDELDKAAGVFGRYLASGEVGNSIMANKQRIMEEIDPDGSWSRDNVLLLGDKYKKQRELAYDHQRQYLNRATTGGYGGNAAVYGALGGLIGGVDGAIIGNASNNTLAGAGIGAGVGAGVGALIGVINRAWQKYKAEKLISDEDIAAMKAQQKDRGLLSEFVPGRDVYDAFKAQPVKAAAFPGDLAPNIQAPAAATNPMEAGNSAFMGAVTGQPASAPEPMLSEIAQAPQATPEPLTPEPLLNARDAGNIAYKANGGNAGTADLLSRVMGVPAGQVGPAGQPGLVGPGPGPIGAAGAPISPLQSGYEAPASKDPWASVAMTNPMATGAFAPASKATNPLATGAFAPVSTKLEASSFAPKDWEAEFKSQTGTNFEPTSRMDAENMRRLQAGQPTLDVRQFRALGKQASDDQAALLKLAGFFFDRDLDPDTDFDDGEGYDDDLGVDTRIPEQGQQTYAVRETSPSPERHYLDAKGGGYANTRYGTGNLTSIPDEVIMQMANPGMELAQLGQQLGMTTLLDHGAVAAMTKVFDAQTFVAQYVDRMEKSLDALARVIFLLYWKPRDFAKMFGDDDLAILENKLTGVFQSYGDVVLELLQSTGDKIRR